MDEALAYEAPGALPAYVQGSSFGFRDKLFFLMCDLTAMPSPDFLPETLPACARVFDKTVAAMMASNDWRERRAGTAMFVKVNNTRQKGRAAQFLHRSAIAEVLGLSQALSDSRSGGDAIDAEIVSTSVARQLDNRLRDLREKDRQADAATVDDDDEVAGN